MTFTSGAFESGMNDERTLPRLEDRQAYTARLSRRVTHGPSHVRSSIYRELVE